MTNNEATTQHVGELRPFRIDVDQADLDDLADRLARTRLPRPAPGDDGTYGITNAYLSDALDHWRTRFDWRAVERRANAYDQVLTEVDGQPIHLLHVRSAEPDATPLLLVHSYPGSFLDFLDLIDPLVDPVAHGGRAEDAFHVVIPSLPGFAFSTPVVEKGWTSRRVATTLDALMRALGYDAYGVHGSDLGALVARELGRVRPEGFLGLHVLQLFSFPSGDAEEMAQLGPDDVAGLEHLQWFQSVGGYNAMNASRPQTVAVGLSDSPVGLLAYDELFMSFGNGTSKVEIDQVLAQVTLQWLTNTASSVVRYHYEDARADDDGSRNDARTGVAVFADDFRTIKAFAQRDNGNVAHWSHHRSGGHYAAMEVPDVLAADLRTFFAG
ncbi:UNVERIFIED_CONTAM: epoxide hydrolase [Mumia flava]|nr:epoxide hydrolase family protein [Mumia flava]